MDWFLCLDYVLSLCNFFHCIAHTINYKHNLKHIQHHQSPAEKLPVTVANFFSANPICDLFLCEQEKHNPKTAVLISHKIIWHKIEHLWSNPITFKEEPTCNSHKRDFTSTVFFSIFLLSNLMIFPLPTF